MLAHWHTRTALLALFAVTHASAVEDASLPSGPPTYRSTVSEVRVTFFATNENNHPLATLTKSDFAIVDNELVVRNFRSFTHTDETSLDVVALVDLSQSVAPRFRVAVSNVLQLVARAQSIPDDNIAVLSFGGMFGGTSGGTSGGMRPAVLCSGGCGASDFVSRLHPVTSSGTTPLFDVLIFGADSISRFQKKELAVRIDDARHESRFAIKEMTLRSEWELLQRHIEDQLNDSPHRSVNTAMALRNRE